MMTSLHDTNDDVIGMHAYRTDVSVGGAVLRLPPLSFHWLMSDMACFFRAERASAISCAVCTKDSMYIF